MRILYIDIDSLRPDHLGCYGYHRNTSPNIDLLAAAGMRFTNVYISDAPCLPSRTALWSGRNGFQTGVINHGGVASEPFIEGRERGWRGVFGDTGWMNALNSAGMKTVTVSSFGDRHGAWHWYASYNEIYNTGLEGMDRADQIGPIALDWLDRNGKADNWFLHVNFWDPHTPFRTPSSYGDPFKDDPIPSWVTEDVWRKSWDGYGPHSPQEVNGLFGETFPEYPRHPDAIDSMEAVRQWFDGYDTGIHYADNWVGRILNKLSDLNIDGETAIIISADHGENIGELNVWGDHQTADEYTCNIPLIMHWPSVTRASSVDNGLYYHYDWAATTIELLGGNVPENWDGLSFAKDLQNGQLVSRPFLVTSQGTWSCQRGVRFRHDETDWLFLRTYHDGYKQFSPSMLFNLTVDPHEQVNVAAERPGLVQQAVHYLESWLVEQMKRSTTNTDPMMTVLREGGPFYTRDLLPAYLDRLRATGRGKHADTLTEIHS